MVNAPLREKSKSVKVYRASKKIHWDTIRSQVPRKGNPEYNAPIFLDCCALIRKAVNDLADDFGFLLGRWNQNYQLSTLPDPCTFDELKPGDLIFYEATYYNPEKAKNQKLNIVHVEMFYPGKTGQGTIGSRWQKGKCKSSILISLYQKIITP